MAENSLLKDLFTYNQYANDQIVSSLTAYAITEGRCIELFSHLLNAQHVWIMLIKKEIPKYGVWQTHDPSIFKKIDQDNHQNTWQLLDKIQDLRSSVSYQNSGGKSFTNSLKDILLHISNHSTYHRGQIASSIRALGFDTPVTDYIFYQRDKK